MKANDLPILSKNQIDEIASSLVYEFQPEIFESPGYFDIEAFSELYLEVNIDYQYLSNDGRYLGMMVFNNTDHIHIYNPELGRAEYLSVDEYTAIIDNTLLEKENENIYRFTLAHETAGHAYLHKDYYLTNPNQLSFLEKDDDPIIMCRLREIGTYGLMSNRQFQTNKEWMEWQANYMASSILMPKGSILYLIDKYKMKFIFDEHIQNNIHFISETFKVSKSAAEIRLKNLGLIRSISDQSAEQLQI